MELLQQSFALIAVFTLLGGAVWFLKTKQRPSLKIRGERRMEIVERIALTPQHNLCLVKGRQPATHDRYRAFQLSVDGNDRGAG